MIADIGYALTAVAYTLLLLLLLTVRKAGLAKYLLMLASVVTVVWAGGLVTKLFGPINLYYLLTLDVVKQGIWLLFLASCLRSDFTSLAQILKNSSTLAIMTPPVVALGVVSLTSVSINWIYLAHIILALEILTLLELLYRQAGDNKWAYKPLVLYLGATSLFDFVMYANASLVTYIDLGYIAARGYLYVMLLPLLVLSIRRIQQWGITIFISREIVLHSSLLLVASAYLFLMAIVGYAINYIGGSWGSTVQIVLMGLSVVLLGTLFMSNQVRTRIKVFITKHFFANQYDYREEWIHLTQALSQPTESLEDVYTVALESMLDTIDYDSGSLVKLQNEEFVIVAQSRYGTLNDADLNLLQKIRRHQDKSWLIDIASFRNKPYAYDDLPLSRSETDECQFQILIPFYHEEKLWGCALLQTIDRQKIVVNWEVRDYLNAVAEQVSNYVNLHEAAKVLAENAQFAAFSRMSAFVLHDLKNVMAQIDLILCNAEQHKDNPEFIDDTFETLHHTKSRMDRMLKQLNEKKVAETGSLSSHKLSELIEQVISQRCHQLTPTPQMTVIEEHRVMLDHEKFNNVMYHLLSNAQQATDDNGVITVTLLVSEGQQRVIIEDSGIGMERAFIEQRLFKPFDTTKGNAGMGIGAYDAKTYMESIGGKLEVQSVVGEGSMFTLTFPTGLIQASSK